MFSVTFSNPLRVDSCLSHSSSWLWLCDLLRRGVGEKRYLGTDHPHSWQSWKISSHRH